jgi:hypothetical protein
MTISLERSVGRSEDGALTCGIERVDAVGPVHERHLFADFDVRTALELG